jgi:hypothetical protein
MYASVVSLGPAKYAAKATATSTAIAIATRLLHQLTRTSALGRKPSRSGCSKPLLQRLATDCDIARHFATREPAASLLTVSGPKWCLRNAARCAIKFSMAWGSSRPGADASELSEAWRQNGDKQFLDCLTT